MKNDNVNIDQKSILAKLLATENITVQHNNVPTASFDVKNRILTLPIFKVKSKDVYDMLTGHECAHALWTNPDNWKEIMNNDTLRQICNVLEDCRIDKMIQAKYPGLVKNYINGFDILNNANFFGLDDHDINDLSIIDKINVFWKSSKRLDINFTDEEKPYLPEVDNLKTFEDVIKLAKKLVKYQKKKDEENKLDKDGDIKIETSPDGENEMNQSESGESNSGEKEKIDKDDMKEEEGKSQSSENDKSEEGEGQNEEGLTPNATGAGGKTKITKPVSITNQNFEDAIKKFVDTDDNSKRRYVTLPKCNLKQTVITYKQFLKDWNKLKSNGNSKYKSEYRKDEIGFYDYLKKDYKKFKNDSLKTVMYLVKEFEMKKSANAYKRATTDKTGVIDPLKLKDYKFSEDIFKRMTILPDGKNHGMMVLVDWSGSMYDIIKPVTEQLSNLAWFCQKVGIPYEMYLFNSDRGHPRYADKTWIYKEGDLNLENFALVNVASSRMKKTELDDSLTCMRWLALHYSNRNHYVDDMPSPWYPGDDGIAEYLGLGSTPLNEALVACTELVPMFKEKYNVEKFSFITLTDGYANTTNRSMKWCTNEDGKTSLESKHDETYKTVVKVKNRQYFSKNDYWGGGGLTESLLEVIKKEFNTTNIGFYLMKSKSRREVEREYSTYQRVKGRYRLVHDMDKTMKTFKKDGCISIDKKGYDEYFLTDGSQSVKSAELQELSEDAKPGEIKRMFAGSMKKRLTSRILLNKFIEKVA